jgi:hypothetical protein
MVKKRKDKETSKLEAGTATGKTKIGLTCIGEICFNDGGFVIKLPENANPECAIKTAELILAGNSNVVFEVPGRGVIEKSKLKKELDDAKLEDAKHDRERI